MQVVRFKRPPIEPPSRGPACRFGRMACRPIPSLRRILFHFISLLVFLAAASTALTGVRAQRNEPLVTAASGSPEQLRVVKPSEDDLLILEMQINRLVLSEGLIAYQIPSGVCLYLAEFARALDFPIEVDLEAGRAEGWFLREDRIFVLDLARREVTIAGEARAFDTNRLQLHPDGICVELTLLSAWFPIQLKLDLSDAIVDVISREPLPIELRLAREKQRAGLGQGQGRMPDYPIVDNPYRVLTWPVVDVFIDSRFTKDDGGTEHTERYNILAAGDLAWLNGELFLTGNREDALSGVRARLGRKDPDRALLGPLRATEFTLGDIATPQNPLVAGSKAGRGVEVSSFPLDQPEEFDRTTLRGELPVGWEVELYRNSVLLDFRVARDDGRYEFIDVPVLFGRNELRLVFYGPQGQVREETEETFIGLELVRPGDVYFRAAVNQQDQDLITVTEETRTTETQGDVRVVTQFEAGIADGWSVGGGLYSLPFENQRRNYLSLGLHTTMAGFATRLDLAADDDGNAAGEISTQGFLGPVNFFARHAQFSDFISERAGASGGDTLTSRSVVRMDSFIPIADRFHLPISFNARHERHESGLNEISLSNRLSTAYQKFLVTNDLSLDLTTGGSADTRKSANGALRLNYRLFPVVLRGEAIYEIEPETEVTNLVLTGDWDVEEDMTIRGSISHSVRDRVTAYQASLNKRFETFAVGANVGGSSEKTYFAGISVSLSLDRDPRSGSFNVSSAHKAARGRALARVFVDENRNGRFDDDDQPLPDVRLLADRRKIKARTDDNGTVFIDDLRAYRGVNISVFEGSIEDPYMVPAIEGLRILVRPGAFATVEFPLLRTGEVDGTVYSNRGGRVSSYSGIQMEILNEAHEIVQTTMTEFDGFYLFELVPLGRYVVRPSPDQLAKLALERSPEQEALLTAEEPVVSGVDFTVGSADTQIAIAPSPVEAPPAVQDASAAYRVHLTSVRNPDFVQPDWNRLQKTHGDLLKDLELTVEKAEIGSERVLYHRLHAGPLSAKEAQALCAAFAARGVWCRVVGPAT